MKWEYLVKDIEDWNAASEEMKWLNELGEQGWELVQVDYELRSYFFKRLKQE